MLILNRINSELTEFESEDIQIVNGFFFNQKKTIERIYRYYHSEYENGSIDQDGDKKYFFNIVRNPCKVVTKAIDFDTKDIKIQTASGGNPETTWYFERDLKYWMKDKGFGLVLNGIFDQLPVLGSVVLKVIDGKPYFVDLRNFVVDQMADTLSQANYIIERHLYTKLEFKKVGEKMGWNGIAETIDKFEKMDAPYIQVYERYGEWEGSYNRLLVADVGKDTLNQISGHTIPYNGVILKQDTIDSHPYWEFHLEKIQGRWLGKGIVETLFDAQVRQNEIANLQAKGSYWAALRIFQCRDATANRNLKTEVSSGEVLDVESEITQIDMSDRNLAFFNQETEKWLANRDELTFSYDVVQGERLPAGTPLGSAKIAAAMTASHFDQIRENIALNIKEFLYKVIIPQFEKESMQEHTLRLVGEDLDKYRNVLISEKARNSLFGNIIKNDRVPATKMFETMKTAIFEAEKQGTEKLLKLPKSFYRNLKYMIDIVITGEQKDTRVRSQSLFAILQAITTDPTMVTDPVKRKILYMTMEDAGINPVGIFPAEEPSMKNLMASMPMPKGAGGGVSRPMPSMAGSAKSQETL